MSPVNWCRLPQFREGHLRVCNVDTGNDAHVAGAGDILAVDTAAGAADDRARGRTPPMVQWPADPALQMKLTPQANICMFLGYATLILPPRLEA